MSHTAGCNDTLMTGCNGEVKKKDGRMKQRCSSRTRDVMVEVTGMEANLQWIRE